MKLLWIIVSAIIIGFTVFLTYMGTFQTIAISEKPLGPYYFIYKEMSGSDMGEIGTITTEIHQFLAYKEIEGAKPFDVFYPEGSGSKTEIGFIINSQDTIRLGDRRGFQFKMIPEQTYMVTEFPFRNRLSFMIGYFKINPALKKYHEAHGYRQTAAMTINAGSTIIYLQPVVPIP